MQTGSPIAMILARMAKQPRLGAAMGALPMISGHGVPGRRFALQGRKRLAKLGRSPARLSLRAHLMPALARTEGELHPPVLASPHASAAGLSPHAIPARAA